MLEQDVEGRMARGKVLAGGTVLRGPPSQVPRGRDGFMAPLAQPSPLLPSSSLLGTEAREQGHTAGLCLLSSSSRAESGVHMSHPGLSEAPGMVAVLPPRGPEMTEVKARDAVLLGQTRPRISRDGQPGSPGRVLGPRPQAPSHMLWTALGAGGLHTLEGTLLVW